MTQSLARIYASNKSGNAATATVQSVRAANATTIAVDTVQDIPTDFMASMGTPHTFTDPVTSETITVISEATAVDFAGHVDSGNLIIDTIAPGYTDAGSAVGDIVVIRPTTQWADNVADTMAVSHNDDGTIKSPEGQLFNGRIVPSVASNNLTVAIKTLAGVDPTAADPVYANIGGTIHSITAALSVSLAAGTNWFGKGTAPFAANPSMFFVYFGYNATDGVTLGVASIPKALKYSDFSTTSTDWNYAKISTTTHASSTDVYENVGRFNATLGVSSTYYWSLPASAVSVAQPAASLTGLLQNAKTAVTTSTNTPSNGANTDLGSNGASLSFTIETGAIAFVTIDITCESTQDFEFRPQLFLDGVVYETYAPSAALGGGAGDRGVYRGFSTVIELTSGTHTLSPGLFIASAASQSIPAGAAKITALVLGDVLK
jgi:hypothetical protein